MNWLSVVAQQWAAQSNWELLAVVLALGYVWLAARQSIWCWPCALVSTAIYSWLFWEHTLPLQTLLNLYYLVMAVYGWWHWRAMADTEPCQVQKRSGWYHLSAVLLLLPLSLAIGWSLKSYFNSEHLYVDALVTVFSLFTTYLVTQKVLENWLYWLVINSFAAWLYWQTGLYLTALLFVGYLGFALYGYIKWRSSYLQDPHAVG